MASRAHPRSAKRRVLRTADDVLVLLRKEVAKVGSIRAFAETHGVNHGYISQVLSGIEKPGPKVLATLGLRRVVSYEAL